MSLNWKRDSTWNKIKYNINSTVFKVYYNFVLSILLTGMKKVEVTSKKIRKLLFILSLTIEPHRKDVIQFITGR